MSKIGDALRSFAGKVRPPRDAVPRSWENFSVPTEFPPSRPLDSTAPADIPREGRRKVLFVDDEPVIVDTFAMILGQIGYQVLKAYSGEQALAILENLRPDILFADIVMYGVNGVEVAMAARVRWPDCLIFLTTGSAGNLRLLEPATAAGFEFHLLGRPIHPLDLMRFFATAPLLPQPE